MTLATVGSCDARSCAWNVDRSCRAREIRIQVTRTGMMACWTYTDVTNRTKEDEENGGRERADR